MKIIAIAAMAENRTIGRSGKIPWNIPEDFQHFRKTTQGFPIVMGRKTFESIGRILPGRENIVLTRGDFHHEGITIFHDYYSLQKYLAEKKVEKIFICGGSQIYQYFLDEGLIDEIILSIVKGKYKGDAFFPEFESDYHEDSREEYDQFKVLRYVKN